MLRGAALRVTRPRVAVLDAVRAHPPADTDWVADAVRADLPAVSHQAGYDSSRAPTAAGPVRRSRPSGSLARSESRVEDNHHHVARGLRGRVADLDRAAANFWSP
ncbi:hypothetical protein GCM10023322_42970 [Rugosimonospora acidiphila]|uniref:Uncharacterized protein n=2 Tax=Rugosimonospora acidiphila TaxID=556531 RepID=A0ABP9RZW8_9ACTN